MSSPWRSWRCRCRSLANTRGGCRRRGSPVSPRTHPTDGRSSASCLCIKESIDGSNGLLWHPYAFVWRLSEGVRGPSRWAGSHGAHRAARRASGIVANQNGKTARGHEGVRIGPPAGRVGRGRASMANARQAKARRRFRNRRFRYVTRAAGRGPKVSKRREPGGNRQSEGTKETPETE